MRPKPPCVTFGPALVPLKQHFHISAINAAVFTKQRNAALFDRRRHRGRVVGQGGCDRRVTQRFVATSQSVTASCPQAHRRKLSPR